MNFEWNWELNESEYDVECDTECESYPVHVISSPWKLLSYPYLSACGIWGGGGDAVAIRLTSDELPQTDRCGGGQGGGEAGDEWAAGADDWPVRMMSCHPA